MKLRRAIANCIIHRHDRRQWRNVQLDQFGSILRLGQGFRDNCHNRLTHMTHSPGRQNRARRLYQGGAVLALHRQIVGQCAQAGRFDIGRCQNRENPRRGLGRTDVQSPDVAMGHGRPHENRIGLTFKVLVVGIVAATAQQTRIFGAGDRLADRVRPGSENHIFHVTHSLSQRLPCCLFPAGNSHRPSHFR